MGISLKPPGEVADRWGGPREGGSEGPPRSRLCLGSAEPGVAETSAGHLERLGSEDSLWLSPRCRFGESLPLASFPLLQSGEHVCSVLGGPPLFLCYRSQCPGLLVGVR